VGRWGWGLWGESRDPIAANLPTVITVEIDRLCFNLYGLPKFTVMKMSNLRNNLGLLNIYMMLSLLYMLCQGWRSFPPMLNVSCVFMNPLINRAPSFTSIGGPTGTRNNIYSFHVLGVNRVFYRSKQATNGVKGSKGWGNIMLPKDSSNLVSGPLNEREIHPWDSIYRVFLNLGTFASYK